MFTVVFTVDLLGAVFFIVDFVVLRSVVTRVVFLALFTIDVGFLVEEALFAPLPDDRLAFTLFLPQSSKPKGSKRMPSDVAINLNKAPISLSF